MFNALYIWEKKKRFNVSQSISFDGILEDDFITAE